MDLRAIVHSHPEIVSGEPVFVGTCVPIRNQMDRLEGGHTMNGFLDNLLFAHRGEAEAFLTYATGPR